jgi:hypothetical protein
MPNKAYIFLPEMKKPDLGDGYFDKFVSNNHYFSTKSGHGFCFKGNWLIADCRWADPFP